MEKINSQKLKQALPTLKENVPLADHTTFKIGGPAKYFFEAKNKSDLIKAVKTACNYELPFFILGAGSNLLVADEGYKGLVIKIQDSSPEPRRVPRKVGARRDKGLLPRRQAGKIQDHEIEAGAGLELSKLVELSSQQGWTGLEWAAGIPGTVGGAIRGNAGAFGESMQEIIKEVEVLNSKNLELKRFKKKECKFGYRNSMFKQNKNLIILSAKFELKEGNNQQIRTKIKKNLDYRKQHHPLEMPSMGSIFRNPSFANLHQSTPNSKNISDIRSELEKISNEKIPAGFLIEKCGLKGKRVGSAQISEKHANFIVNLGDAKAEDVRKLINLAQDKVKKKFGIKLKPEIQLLGF